MANTMSTKEDRAADVEVIDSRYPSVEHLRERARKRMPRFDFEYLEGGCNSEINLRRNTEEIREVQIKPWYLRDYSGSDPRTELFGKTYDAPFGISPIGLQGLMWPRATEILAEAAHAHNVPLKQLQQVMEQIGCERIPDFPNHLITSSSK